MIRFRWSRRSRLAGTLLLLLLVLAAAACGGEGEKSVESLSERTLTPGQMVPAPTGKPVLEIAGKREARNDGDRLVLDLPTLERLGLIRYSVEDPWLKRRVTYTGVRLSDLATLAAPSKSATSMHFAALDDYQVDISLADAERWPIMLATRLDGQRMAISNGGPTRIVFPYGLVDGIDELKHKDLWIWNIKSITFR